MRSSFVLIDIYDHSDKDGINHARVQYERQDNDLMHGTIIISNNREWSENHYSEIVEFADKELRSLGIVVK